MNMSESEFLTVYQQIEQTNNSLAIEILKDAALLHSDEIPERLYAEADPKELDNALDLLESYNLIERVRETAMFTIDKNLQQIIMSTIDG